MSCVYLLDGHQFNSEIELDDFLLAKNYLRKELGDIVFQISTKLNMIMLEIIEYFLMNEILMNLEHHIKV